MFFTTLNRLLNSSVEHLKKSGPNIFFLETDYDFLFEDSILLFKSINIFPKCFFKTPEHKEILLGFEKCFELEKIEDSVLYPDLYFMGANRFNSHTQHQSNEWKNFQDHFWIPTIQILKLENRMTIRIHFVINESQDHKSIEQLYIQKKEQIKSALKQAMLDSIQKQTKNIIWDNVIEFPGKALWANAVEEAKTKIKSQSFTKVALARKKIFTAKEYVPPTFLLDKFNFSDFENNFIFMLSPSQHQIFISLTPERLIKIKGDIIHTMSLAGTLKRGSSQEEDKYLENLLLNSPKNLQEQKIVTEQIATILSPLTEEVQIPEHPQILKQKHVQHLFTPIAGKMLKHITPNQLIKALHPTAAVAGIPKSGAIQFIDRQEHFDRGLYAGPCGFISHQESDLCVAIRSCLIHQNQIHLFGGAGIVLDSDPLSEWDETDRKMKGFETLI